MWAAYQGDVLSVGMLLKHGANPNTRDDVGLTPLHWAVVRGNKVCILKLFEKGAEIHAKDNGGRTAGDMAVELKSLGAWKRALEEEGGFTEDGSRRLGDGCPHCMSQSQAAGANSNFSPEEYQVG
jgi:palmitoyltransferase ZDHHC13/17